MIMKLNSKRVALVTGANRGIGFAIAQQLASKDITVLIGARNEAKGKILELSLTLVENTWMTPLHLQDPII
jgi:NAD(P)-dependent dehydrogenase (short-subunit alcohol dehydrogenase family)